MCLIAAAVDVPGPWLLVLAANRDEFHDRHTAPAAWWRGTSPHIFGGRDLQAGGTWLGLGRRGHDGGLRVGALTNLRPGLMPPPATPAAPDGVPPSRGRLVADYLSAKAGPSAFLASLDPPPAVFAGFNLLAIQAAGGRDGVDAWYLNNLPGSRPRRLASGVHVVSNATLDVDWPKTRLLRDAMTRALAATTGAVVDADADGPGEAAPIAQPDAEADAGPERLEALLFEALADRSTAPAAALPRTGLDPERERLLSAPFIVDDHYGTRCSTVLGVRRDGFVFFTEQRFGPAGRTLGAVRERFTLPWVSESRH